MREFYGSASQNNKETIVKAYTEIVAADARDSFVPIGNCYQLSKEQQSAGDLRVGPHEYTATAFTKNKVDDVRVANNNFKV